MSDYTTDAAERFALLDLDDWGPADAAPSPRAAEIAMRTELVRAAIGPFQPDATGPAPAPSEVADLAAAVAANSPATQPEPIRAPRSELAADLPPTFRDALESARTRNRASTETPGQRAARERVAAERKAREALDGTIRIALGGDNQTYPHGCLVAWRPTGELPWETIASAAIAADVDPPAKRTARAVASEAVRALVGKGLMVDTLRRGSSWAVYAGAKVTQVGAPIGETRLVATLVGDELSLEGPDHLVRVVRSAWEHARAVATLTTGEITAWLVRILTGWRAVTTAYGRWLPPGPVTERWCALAYELSERGVSIPRRPAGVQSPDQVADEIRAGLAAEIEASISAIAADRSRMLAKSTDKKACDLGPKAAITALGEIESLRSKIALYECLAGPMTESRAALDAMEEILRPLADEDPVAQRGAVLEME